jgi:replicative DNA helicase
MAVVGARPGHGKTAFAMQWLDNVAEGGTPCLIISAEMSAYELGRRAILSNTRYDGQEVKDNPEQVIKDVEEIYAKKAPIYVEDQAYGIDEICTLIENHCSVNGARFVAIDYIQLLGSTKPGRYEQVTEISQRLKQVAKRCQCAVVALCQLSRESERREQWNPQLADLKESGQIEQDADIVMFLCWLHKIVKDETDERKYTIRIAKRRNGPVKKEWIMTTFNPERQAFGDYEGNGVQGVSQPLIPKQDSEDPDSVEGASLF